MNGERDKENQETKSVIGQRDNSIIKKNMRGDVEVKHSHKYSKSRVLNGVYGSKNFGNNMNRHSMNLMSLKHNNLYTENMNPNKSVLDFKYNESYLKHSQKTNDFWTLSKDSSQLDIKKKFFCTDIKKEEMSVSFKINEAFRKVNDEGSKELNLSNLKLTDKDLNRLSKRLKSLAPIKIIKLEKNELTGNTNN